MIFYFSCVSKERRDAYFVSDKVLLQSKKLLRGAFLHTNQRRRERERGDTDTKETEKATHKKKRGSDSISCFVLPFISVLFFFLSFGNCISSSSFFSSYHLHFLTCLLLNSLFFLRDLRWVSVISQFGRIFFVLSLESASYIEDSF